MQFHTHVDYPVDIAGTGLVGEFCLPYAKLVDLFGPPTTGDGYKTDAEWHLLFEDGTIATVYNWKNGVNYCEEDGLPIEEMTDWHVGGHDATAMHNVLEALIFKFGD